MYVKKNFGFKEIMRFSGWHIIWLTLWAIAVPAFIETLHYFRIESFKVPWLPVSLVGTAVAFYVGFKNNSSYDRLWEARKIWGAIVNSSRMWGSSVRAYVSNQFVEDDLSVKELQEMHKRMIYRHIGWLYSLRSQLLLQFGRHPLQKNTREQLAHHRKNHDWSVVLWKCRIPLY